MTATPGPLPTAEGSLERTPLVHLLVYMADRQLTGSIVLQGPPPEPGLEHTLYFVEGVASKLRTGELIAPLGRVLFELGHISEATLDESLAAIAGQGELHGEYLVRTHAIHREQLIAGLRSQALRQIAYLFGVSPATTFAFYENVNLLENWGGPELVPLDPLPTIWSGVRVRADEPIIDATLARLSTTTLKLHAQSDTSRFGFSPQEVAVIDFIRARPITLETLVASGVAPPRTIQLVVYALLITRHLDHGASAAPPVGVQRAVDPPAMRAGPASVGRVPLARVKLTSRRPSDEPTPISSIPPSLSPEHMTRREAIVRRSAMIDREDYFAILGVARDTAEADIQSAYYALAKTWHPDRLPAELASARDAASKVFARISEAFETLSNPGRRKRYTEVLKGGTGTPEEADKIQQIIDAATDFQRAEILWKRHDAGAEQFILRAYKADPEQSDYIALYVMLQLSKRPSDAPVDDLVKLCDRAIENSERCERAYFCRATLKKRMGRIESAMADFRSAYQFNPKNLDAAREVRLYEMRRSKTERRSNPGAARRSTPAPTAGQSNPPPARSTLPQRKASNPPPKKDGGVLSGLGKLFKR